MVSYRFLIVEDGLENIEAAKKAIKGLNADPGKLKIEFATTLAEGMHKLNSEKFNRAIFDLELPVKSGKRPDVNGFQLVEIAEKIGICWAVLTGKTEGLDAGHSANASCIMYHKPKYSHLQTDRGPKGFEKWGQWEWGWGSKKCSQTWYDVIGSLL